MNQGERPDDQKLIAVGMYRYEWDLLLEHVFVDDDIQARIRNTPIADEWLVVGLTVNELDDLAGHAAFAANHAGRKDLMKQLSEICDILEMKLP